MRCRKGSDSDSALGLAPGSGSGWGWSAIPGTSDAETRARGHRRQPGPALWGLDPKEPRSLTAWSPGDGAASSTCSPLPAPRRGPATGPPPVQGPVYLPGGSKTLGGSHGPRGLQSLASALQALAPLRRAPARPLRAQMPGQHLQAAPALGLSSGPLLGPPLDLPVRPSGHGAKPVVEPIPRGPPCLLARA
mmetsp:Transcript_56515/g.122154  ORF Transcript_56515/g.122154 Transcript_56515/m.122154 type:complete len:191 (+) Transcript_56515:300-872(+)